MRGVLTIIVLGLSVGLVCWVCIADAFEASLDEVQVGGPPNVRFCPGGVEGAAPVNLGFRETAFNRLTFNEQQAVALMGHNQVWEAHMALYMG
jgi:hypothetical protein